MRAPRENRPDAEAALLRTAAHAGEVLLTLSGLPGRYALQSDEQKEEARRLAGEHDAMLRKMDGYLDSRASHQNDQQHHLTLTQGKADPTGEVIARPIAETTKES